MLNCFDMKNNFNIFAETIVQLFKIKTNNECILCNNKRGKTPLCKSLR